jgi:Skp family chaperone for outer membrane proteins
VPQASAGAAELAAAQARSVGQLQALESQLASKDAALDASQVRLAALEVELKGAHSKVRRTLFGFRQKLVHVACWGCSPFCTI